ncbi:glycosyltransferase family 2 protein [Poseidonocella sp. HB161398]|uniref:glycosyltransferase family 2 protein n=1 Tax=Poseidonocella sp. HB161398 TaxID=2320855 RepID=UPI001487483A|nr:glycosyltransferase family 2 protein [Poseidonocella sp. HB161398]
MGLFPLRRAPGLGRPDPLAGAQRRRAAAFVRPGHCRRRAKRPAAALNHCLQQSLRLALFGIVKDEAGYLTGWLAWHRAPGVTGFIIADSDRTSGLLAQLGRRRVLRRFAMPARFHEIPQLGAYARAARPTELTGLGWIAFLDADEFLLPAGPGEDLRRLPGKVAPDIGSVSFTRAVCGSSGHLAAGPGPGPCRRPLCEGAEARTGIKDPAVRSLRRQPADTASRASRARFPPCRRRSAAARPDAGGSASAPSGRPSASTTTRCGPGANPCRRSGSGALSASRR